MPLEYKGLSTDTIAGEKLSYFDNKKATEKVRIDNRMKKTYR